MEKMFGTMMPRGAGKLRLSKMNMAGMGTSMMKKIMNDKNVDSLESLIKKAMDDLPPEKRKSYLFRPQTMLTQQRLFETILGADGITPEMIKSQQEKLHLLQQLLGASAEGLPEMIRQNDEKIDEEVFMLLSRLAQASAAAGDRQSRTADPGLSGRRRAWA